MNRRRRLLDPSIVNRRQQLLSDVRHQFSTEATGHPDGWSIGEGPGLSRIGPVVLDVRLARIRILPMELLIRRASGH